MEKLKYTDTEIESIKNIFEKYKFVCKVEEENILVVLVEDMSSELIEWFYVGSYISQNHRYFTCTKAYKSKISLALRISDIRPDLIENDYVSMFEELYDLLNYHSNNFMYKVISRDDWYVIINKPRQKGENITNEQCNESWLNWDWEYRIGKCKLTENMYYLLQLIERDLLVQSREREDCFENKGCYTRFDNVKDSIKYSKKLLVPKDPKDSIALSLLIKQDLIRFDGEKYVVNDIK